MGVVLISGGARSGKSRFALEYAARFERRALVATGQALDEEMAERIRRHQAERGPEWTTLEEPLDVAGVIEREGQRFDVMVVDCLTLWLSNVLGDSQRNPLCEMTRLKESLARRRTTQVVLITNEVGSGIVPDNPLARRYRDLAGEMNQLIAAVASEVYWVVFGIPLTVKTEIKS
jgi:adenosyl cobinamide kinase/adenosyl cobinamide phosphate guanylyltransferase